MRRKIMELLRHYDFYQKERDEYREWCAENPGADPEGFEDPGADYEDTIDMIPHSRDQETGLQVETPRKRLHKWLGVEQFFVVAQEDMKPMIEALITLIRGWDASTMVRAPTVEEAKIIITRFLPGGVKGYGTSPEDCEFWLNWHAEKFIEELKKL